jgi:CO/xanthine dehydrogenase Mo-binding subunit
MSQIESLPQAGERPAQGVAAAPVDVGRRGFLVGSVVATAGLALFARVAEAAGESAPAPRPAPTPGVASPAASPFAAYVEIREDGGVWITCPQIEIGQGVYDSLARIVADELDADWPAVQVVQPHADAALASPITKRQRVGGSDSTMAYRDHLRMVGAAAREMLVGAAAARWGVPAAECSTEAGRVRHAASARELGFGELVREAAQRPVPQSPALKPAAALRLTGRRLTRKDTPAKVDGSAVFGIDVREPGMVHAALRRSTSLGGRLRRFDAASVASRPGVVAVVPLDDAVAVVADSWWRARQAAEALDVEFDDLLLGGLSSAGVSASLRRALDDDARAVEWPTLDFSSTPPKRVPADREALARAFARTDVRRVEAQYEVPYAAHLTMEPQVCAARVTAERCEVRAPIQQIDNARKLAATLTGLPFEAVRLEITFAGGGFGRRYELDSLEQTLRIAMAVPGRWVKLLWTREQDLQHDFYRPAHAVRYRGVVDADGNVLALHGRVSGQSIGAYKRMRPPTAKLPDGAAVGGTVPDEYAFGVKLAEFAEVGLPVPIGFWRSVAASHNGFFAESIVDELAHAARQDPWQFRRRLLAAHPRTVAVLDRAAQESGWGRPLGAGRGRGIAVSASFGAICAQVVQVAVRGKRVAIERITCAYDCGPIIDPGIVEAQLQGGIVWGLTAALDGESTIEKGAMRQANFDTQPIMRLPELPRIDVHLMPSEAKIGGVGESGVPPVAPALANAIFAASGRRLRQLPLRKAGLEFAAG